MYGFRTQLMTSYLMSANRVTALKTVHTLYKGLFICCIQLVQSIAFIYMDTLIQHFTTCMVLVGKQHYSKLSVSMKHLCLSVCLFANSFNAKGKCKLFIKDLYPYLNSSFAIYLINFVSST